MPGMTEKKKKRLVELRDKDPEKWTYRKLGEHFKIAEATALYHYKQAKEGKSAPKKTKGKSVTRKPTKKEAKTEAALELRMSEQSGTAFATEVPRALIDSVECGTQTSGR